jgi:hypothetical protein
MKHLTEEDLIAAYYGDAPDGCAEHLQRCAECRAEFSQIKDLLDEIRTAPVPPRTDLYGREVWARVERRLSRSAQRWWSRPWILAPAAAALLVFTFVGGMLTAGEGHHFWSLGGGFGTPKNSARQRIAAVAAPAGLSDNDRERIREGVVRDHLERSEILLAQLVHATPGDLDLARECSRARDLLEENRLLRQTAARSGDETHAALLDDLERVFLDLANSPTRLSSQDVAELQRRIDNQSLLFRVRVTTAGDRSKGNTL